MPRLDSYAEMLRNALVYLFNILNFKSTYINFCATFVQLYFSTIHMYKQRKPLCRNDFACKFNHKILPPTQKTVGSNPAGCAIRKPLQRSGFQLFTL